MRSTILALLAVVFLPVFSYGQTSSRAKYIGYEYEGVMPAASLPNGLKHMGGALLGDIEADPVYGISQVEKGRTKMLWLESSTGRNAGGIAGWKVADVLSFPALAQTDYMFFTGDPGIYCRRNGKHIENLVGVGRIVRRQGVFRPSKLWTADLTTKKFDPVKLSGVKCEYSEP